MLIFWVAKLKRATERFYIWIQTYSHQYSDRKNIEKTDFEADLIKSSVSRKGIIARISKYEKWLSIVYIVDDRRIKLKSSEILAI